DSDSRKARCNRAGSSPSVGLTRHRSPSSSCSFRRGRDAQYPFFLYTPSKVDSGIEFKDSWNHRSPPRSPTQVRRKSLPGSGSWPVPLLDNRSCNGSFREENRALYEILVHACLAHRRARLVIGRNLKNDLLQINKYYIIG